jgi:hypothetical protein
MLFDSRDTSPDADYYLGLQAGKVILALLIFETLLDYEECEDSEAIQAIKLACARILNTAMF